MRNIFKKSISIDFEDSMVYPGIKKTHEAIAKYCERNGYSYTFPADEEVVMNGIPHEIIRVQSVFSRGNYLIKCREK